METSGAIGAEPLTNDTFIERTPSRTRSSPSASWMTTATRPKPVKTRPLTFLGGVIAVAFTAALSPLGFAEQKYSAAEAGRHAGDEATVTGKVASVSKL